MLRNEAENNLALGVLDRLIHDPTDESNGLFLATVEEKGQVIGFAFRTPPNKLSISRMPLEAIPLLVELVAEAYDWLPAVLGPESCCEAFSKRWVKKKGGHFLKGRPQRIYQVEQIIFPQKMVAGTLRPAMEEDEPLLATWISQFYEELQMPTWKNDTPVVKYIRENRLWIWEDSTPCTLVGHVADTPNGFRIGYVYTPVFMRGHGYGTQATAVLTDRLLRSGKHFGFLYTDLTNPVSNRIYSRIGYKPVCDVVDIEFIQ